MKNYYDVVKQLLEGNAGARDDDMYLYALVVAKFKLVRAEDTFYTVMVHSKAMGLPSYESVSRARRKVQENEPSLRGSRYKDRKKEEEEYRGFYSPFCE